MLGVLASTLAVLLAVVVLRAEAARLHYATAQLERRVEALVQELREKDLELARLRNPALIRARIEELRLGENRGAESSARLGTSRP